MVDRYTRMILTVIAAALVALVIQESVRQSRAMDGIQMVKICDSAVACVSTIPTGTLESGLKWALAVRSN